MRYYKLLIFLLLSSSSISGIAQNNTPLKPCPKSPNCVSTLESKGRKKMSVLPFIGDLEKSKTKLKEIVLTIKGATLVVEESNYLHFEFSTSMGKFIDDVEFYFDESTQHIHFRSASRIGYGDFGANKRRMKKITKLWKSHLKYTI
ncbi:MAG: DUF1499 domain-containing protein [Crocinitomix sp.]|nr:DUF1499 domain-containing protein [Crocinitomix sp.]